MNPFLTYILVRKYVCTYVYMYVCLGIPTEHFNQKGRILACALQECERTLLTRGHGNGCSFAIATPT